MEAKIEAVITEHLLTPVEKIVLISHCENTRTYLADTAFGSMTLCTQYFGDAMSVEKDCAVIEERNRLIGDKKIITPLIFEQRIVRLEKEILCLTLLEEVVAFGEKQLLDSKDKHNYSTLILAGLSSSSLSYHYDDSSYQINSVLRSVHSGNIYFDFTKIDLRNQGDPSKERMRFEQFKGSLLKLLSKEWGDRIAEILFIKEKTYRLDLPRLQAAYNWLDMALLMNLLPQAKVTLRTPKVKVKDISRLDGSCDFQLEGQSFKDCVFADGIRTDVFRLLHYQQLHLCFFEEHVAYHVKKAQYMIVKKSPAPKQPKYGQPIYDQIIQVESKVSKIQFLNFLLAYIREIEPIVQLIEYNKSLNSLYLVFRNRKREVKRVLIRFDGKYVVKDEQLSIIVEKSSLEKAVLSLREMDFGDSFFYFLANSDKTSHIRKIDVSYCPKLTESAVNSLVMSPFCKKLEVLHICAVSFNISLLSFAKSIKELQINECKPNGEQEVNFRALQLEKLEAIGVNIALEFSESLKFLALTCEVSVDSLKELKNLSLVHLQMRLVDSKKNFVDFLTNIYKQDSSPIRQFAEGNSKLTLKSIDLSNSSVKWKDLKPIFSMEVLEQIVLDNYDRERLGDVTPLAGNISSLSLQRVRLTSTQIKEILSKINCMSALNLVDTDVKADDLELICKGKQIILLSISENQVYYKFSPLSLKVQKLQIHVDKLMSSSNEETLNELVCSTLLAKKTLDLLCPKNKEDTLRKSLEIFLRFHRHKNQKLALQKQIAVNGFPLNFRREINGNHTEKMIILLQQKHPLSVELRSDVLMRNQNRQLNMSEFFYGFYQKINSFPRSLIELSIRGNRLLGKDCITVVLTYARNYLRAIDFRECLFGFKEVREQLWQFPYLSSVNQGQYSMSFTKDNFSFQTQEYLKFMMRISKGEMHLEIQVEDIAEADLAYSVLYHIIDHHSESIVAVVFSAEVYRLSPQILFFWAKLFQIKQLKTLSVCFGKFESMPEDMEVQFRKQFQLLNDLPIRSLSLRVPERILLGSLAGKDIRKLSIDVSRSAIHDGTILRLLKPLASLSTLKLCLSHCPNVISLVKLSHWLEKLNLLQILHLQIEGCTIKENQVCELLRTLKGNGLLREVYLDARNCIKSASDLIAAALEMKNELRFCHLQIVAISERTSEYPLDARSLLQRGISVLL